MTSQQAIQQLQQLEKDSRKAMKEAERKFATSVVQDARSLAPVNAGELIESIGFEQTEIETDIFADAGYAAYVEFGTGPLVEVPPGLEDYARTFFITGKGHQPAHPFFFPAIFRNE